jgi:SAM-dependent methyltransferase
MDDADAFTAFEVAGWERRAAHYGDFAGHVSSRLADPLLDAAGVGSGVRTIDVATGPGYVAAAAAERGADVIGVDVSAAMVTLARTRHPGLDFRQADAESLPFDDGTFDAVVANFLVPHLAHHDRTMVELVRVLAPGGRLALTTWDTPDRMRLLGVLLDALAEVGAEPPADLPPGPPFFLYADEARFAGLLTDAGLSDVAVDTVAFDFHVSTADELWDGVRTGTVRTGVLLEGLPGPVLRDVRAAFDRTMLDYRRSDHFELPISVKLARGRRA